MDMWWLPALIVSNLALLLNAAIIFQVGDILQSYSVVHVLSILIHPDQALPSHVHGKNLPRSTQFWLRFGGSSSIQKVTCLGTHCMQCAQFFRRAYFCKNTGVPTCLTFSLSTAGQGLVNRWHPEASACMLDC